MSAGVEKTAAPTGRHRDSAVSPTGNDASNSRRQTRMCDCLLFILLFFMAMVKCSSQGIAGIPQTCDVEGQPVHPLIQEVYPCFTCVCQGGIVQCSRKDCPALPCFARTSSGDRCCPYQCPGCRLEGDSMPASGAWIDVKGSCELRYCNNRVVTRTSKRCVTTCSDPTPPPSDHCCPLCPDCSRPDIPMGEIFASPSERCVHCVCSGEGMRCWKEVCPVLPCSGSQRRKRKDGCCDECVGSKLIFDLKEGQCWFGRGLLRHTEEVKIDPCTICQCQNGTVACERKNCPHLDKCRGSEIFTDSRCCPKCPEDLLNNCTLATGGIARHAEAWNLVEDPCTRCTCDNGTVACVKINCSASPLNCPPGKVLDFTPGICCKTCIDAPGICAVFGDPHYRTFDGRAFNFQGSCGYMLAKDCTDDNTFSLIVENDAKRSAAFSWTRNVLLHLHTIGLNVSLHQRLVTKLNGRKVALPYLNGNLSVFVEKGFVKVRTLAGISLNWDGDSYLEAGASPRLRGNLCGLCGNFNGFARDEFIGGDGSFKFDKNSFADSWRVTDDCTRPDYSSKPTEPCGKSLASRLRAREKCSVFKSPSFRPCYTHVDPTEYYKSCLTDSCECPRHKRCSCESIRAYTSACARRGVMVEWNTNYYCHRTCSRGKFYSTCGPACKFNCRNYKNKRRIRRCKRRRCVAGCRCPAGYVMDRSRCVKPSACPTPAKNPFDGILTRRRSGVHP